MARGAVDVADLTKTTLGYMAEEIKYPVMVRMTPSSLLYDSSLSCRQPTATAASPPGAIRDGVIGLRIG
ncbi:hypothetical protein CFP56_031690 [Quercus suber]|uniref:Uncharacterized protein n=1 Tax=Quercus suber TaxID=58331 RepID=A0AAW0JIV8_QUESU